MARSKFGVQVELDLGCGVLLLRLDPWMAPRTGGLLAQTGATSVLRLAG